MKLIWFTDLHLGADDANHDRFRRCLDHALAAHGDADRIVITGDIAQDGTEADYAAYRRLMGDCPRPVRLVPGNHDNREAMWCALPDTPRSGGGRISYAEELGGYGLIFLDTLWPGSDAGDLGTEQLHWLEGELAEDRPALIFMHHQPGPVFLPSADGIGLADQAEFTGLLARHGKAVAGIFFGHCHRPIAGSLMGVPMMGLPAVAPQMRANFATTDFIPEPEAPPQYGVILAAGGHIVCHTIEPRA